MVKELVTCATANASGAAMMAAQGLVTVIIDVIDMSTSLEAAREMGALACFGASPTNCRAPVDINPKAIGEHAAKIAIENNTNIVVISEPRVGNYKEREANAQELIAGIKEQNCPIEAIVPNLGSEVWKLTEFKNKVVVAVTASGGAVFDAAWTASSSKLVTTATVARTVKKKGTENLQVGIERAVVMAQEHNTGIAFVAASSNSMEDVLACEELYKAMLRKK
ncbi:hypothetical protein GGQ84_001062 [Desulfitispora alkaliphila]|uniref:hypothetical protein n=1 Tax=Desulfitispora alkaliphila TaxID=622674 RepID=UPI003D1FE0B1